MSEIVAVFNAGSSSVKFALYRAARGGALERTLAGAVENVAKRPELKLKQPLAQPQRAAEPPAFGASGIDHVLPPLLEWLIALQSGERLLAVGHRVVHGGGRFCAPVVVTHDVISRLESYTPLAPLHEGPNIAAMKALLGIAPGLPQVACFDTAFHATLPASAIRLALPRAYHDQGIRRYGFHGLSYEFIAENLPHYLGEAAEGRIVVAHLGSGASLCALKQRRSVATTMGFSALDGLMMATRCGALDAGVILYLIRERDMDVEELTDLLYYESGLLGVSGLSADMRVLLASPDQHAREAIELFVYRVVHELGGLAAVLGGLDALVFTGGIGENAAPVREEVCRGAAWLGVELDAAANAHDGPLISTAASRASAWVIPANEELMIARETWRLVTGAATR
jgi:acetate kinase